MASGRAQRRQGARWYYLLALSLAGLILSFGSSIGRQIEWIPPNTTLGLFGMLPLTYWLGVGVIAVSIILGIRGKSESLFAAQFLVLYLVIWGAPSIFERFPSVWDSYMHYSSALSIMNSGSSLAEGLFSYPANYPGFFVTTATYQLLGNAAPIDLIRFYPLIAALFTFVAMYLFARTYLSGLDFKIVLPMIALVNVWVQYSFSPQSLGLAAGLLVFVFLERGGRGWLMMSMAAFAYVVVSHPTTMVLVLGGLVLREVLVRLRAWRSRGSGAYSKWPVHYFALVAVVWLMTGAHAYSSFLFDLIYQKVLYIVYLPEAVGHTAALRTGGNIFPYGSTIRTIALVGFFLALMIAVLLLIRWRKASPPRLRLSMLGLLAVALVFAPMDIFFLEGQVYDRALLFFALSAPLLSVPILLYWKKNRLVLPVIAVLLLMSVACTGTAFYQESLYTVSERSIAASDYLQATMPNHSTVISGHYPDPVWVNHYHRQFLQIENWEVYPDAFNKIIRGDRPTAMVFDRTSLLWNTQFGTLYIYNFYSKAMDNSTKVLENGAYSIIFGGA